MTKNKKDFFESVLSDVKPLKKKRNIEKKKKETENITKETHYEIVPLNKTAIIQKNKPEVTGHKNLITNDKSNFFKKLKKGKVSINKKIDLHGLTLIQAEEKFDREIEISFYEKLRCILFITGKGLRKKDHEKTHVLYYGKIRNNIYRWVHKKQNLEKILYFSVAHPSHGGDGSFYVYLRKE